MNSLIVCDLHLTAQAELVSEKHWSAYNINYSAKVNTPQNISFSIPNSSPHIEHVINNNIVVFKDERYIIRDTTINKDDNTITEVSCEHLSSQLASRINGKFDFKAETINTLVGKVLEGTSWSLGETDIASSNLRHLISTNETILSNLITIAETFGAVCLFTSTKTGGNKVNFYVNKIKRETYLTNTKNIKSISLKYDSNDMLNRIHVFGKINKSTGIETSIVGITGGKTYVEDFSYYLNQGYTQEYINANLDLFLREGELRLSEIDDAQKLYDMGIEELNRKKNPVLNCTVSVLDLSGIPKYFMEQPKLYESVVIRDTELNLDLESTVVGFSKNYDDDLDMTLDISSVIEYSSFMKDVIDKVDKSETDLIEVDKGWKDVIEEAKNTATDIINGGIENSHVILRKDELLIMNTTNPETATQIWRFNLGGLAFGNSYFGQFTTALTNDGKIVLNEATVGKINAQLIKVGILASLNGKTSINMEDGTFNFANKIIYDGSNLNVNVDKLQIKSSDVATQTQLTNTATEINRVISNVDGRVTSVTENLDGFKISTSRGGTQNLIKDSYPKGKISSYWDRSQGGTNTSRIGLGGNGENWNNEYFKGGIWWYCQKNDTNWQHLINNSFRNYKFTVGKKYTLVFPIYCEQENKKLYVLIANGGSADAVTSVWVDLVQGYQWVKWTFTPAQKGTDNLIHFANESGVGEANFYIPWVTLCEGDIAREYHFGADNEIVEGIVDVGMNGVTVSHNQSDTYSNLNADGLKVFSNSGKEIASFGENNKAIIGTLETEVVNAGNVIPQLRDKGSLELWVRATSTGDGSGLNSGNYADSAITALTNLFSQYGIDWDSRGGMILTNTDITIHYGYPQPISENLYIRDFLGGGKIVFDLYKDVVITGKWEFRNCSRVEITGMKTDSNSNDGALFKRSGAINGINIYNCKYVLVQGCRFYNSTTNYSGISCADGTHARIRDCDFYGFNQAVYCNLNSVVSCYNNSGQGFGNYSYYALDGGIMVYSSNRPVGTVKSNYSGSAWLSEGQTSSEKSSVQVSAPPPPSNQSVTQSFKPVSYKSVRSYNTENGSLKQGCYDTSKGDFTGYIEFGNKISDWCSDAVGGISGTITLQRMNDGHGYSGQIPVIINGTNVGSLAHGEKKTFNIPASVLDGLKTGSRTNINLNGKGQSQYIKFETNVSISISATKPI